MKGRSEVLVACPFMVRCVRRRGGSHRHPEDERYFRDIYDHVIRINEMVDSSREILASALEANFSLISISQNEIQKRFAGWAAILAIPTLVAGIYGMNFKFMPELDWSSGGISSALDS